MENVKKVTKTELFEQVKEIVLASDVENVDELVEFINHEVELIAAKAEKAKARKEANKAKGDALKAAVAAALTEEFQSAEGQGAVSLHRGRRRCGGPGEHRLHPPLPGQGPDAGDAGPGPALPLPGRPAVFRDEPPPQDHDVHAPGQAPEDPRGPLPPGGPHVSGDLRPGRQLSGPGCHSPIGTGDPPTLRKRACPIGHAPF